MIFPSVIKEEGSTDMQPKDKIPAADLHRRPRNYFVLNYIYIYIFCQMHSHTWVLKIFFIGT